MESDLTEFLHPPEWAARQPVARIYWLPAELLEANDYNPNIVAPTEMKLLRLSIEKDGFTQPIVVWRRSDGRFEVVDGFHRYQVARQLKLSHLPCVVLDRGEEERNERIAATIRHNRARGKHQVAEMSKIVLELKKRNWTDAEIGKDLGMDPDEVLRLSQIGGLAEAFQDKTFSEAWK